MHSNNDSAQSEIAHKDYEKEFMVTAASDVSNALPPLSREEYEYYMSLPD